MGVGRGGGTGGGAAGAVLTGFPYVWPVEVRFRDLDALGHVNNAVFLTYLESARIGYWLELTGRTGLAGSST